jgi:hypothetical protein
MTSSESLPKRVLDRFFIQRIPEAMPPAGKKRDRASTRLGRLSNSSTELPSRIVLLLYTQAIRNMRSFPGRTRSPFVSTIRQASLLLILIIVSQLNLIVFFILLVLRPLRIALRVL